MYFPDNRSGPVRAGFRCPGVGGRDVEGHLLHAARILPESSQPGNSM